MQKIYWVVMWEIKSFIQEFFQPAQLKSTMKGSHSSYISQHNAQTLVKIGELTRQEEKLVILKISRKQKPIISRNFQLYIYIYIYDLNISIKQNENEIKPNNTLFTETHQKLNKQKMFEIIFRKATYCSIQMMKGLDK